MAISTTSVPAAVSGASATLLVVEGPERRTVAVRKLPFSIGRKPDNDLVLSDPRVSREHALIVQDKDALWLVDQNSKHGTFVNGQKVDRCQLQLNDRLEFGAREGIHVIFGPERVPTPTSEELLSHIGDLTTASDLEKLTLLLEAARKLNTTRVLEDVLLTLLDLTLRLTRAERAYVFLRERDGSLRLAAARDAHGKPLADDNTISRSILNEAATAGCEFLVTDTSRFSDLAARNSIVAYDLRTVICIPLSRAPIGGRPSDTEAGAQDVRGVLYLDSHFASREMSGVSHDVLHAIATEAAALVENAYLVEAEASARQYQQELAIAASIQQNLMAINIPEVPFAAVRARSVPCREIGGDFVDVIRTPDALALVIADVSGKGVSAALLASTLQGMLYSQIMAGVPLVDIATAVNRFLCQKRLEAKYATAVLARVHSDGEIEMVNCGHVLPLVVSGNDAQWVQGTNVPVGLFADSRYEALRFRLNSGDRLLLYTDGVTEATNKAGEFFEEERLREAVTGQSPMDEIFRRVAAFCAGSPPADDCTVLEMTYAGARPSDDTDPSGPRMRA
ncbi:MAG: SpoIIE family protein phosphatase [Terriglobales bacterium]